MPHAPFAMQISPGAVQHEHSLIFLAGLFLDKQEQILESAYPSDWAESICKDNDNRYAQFKAAQTTRHRQDGILQRRWAQGKAVVVWIRQHQSFAISHQSLRNWHAISFAFR